MAEDELATPHWGSRKDRTPVTGPSRTDRAKRSAALGSGAQTLRRGGSGGGRCLFPGLDPPAPAAACPGDDTAFPPHPALPASPRSTRRRAPAGQLATSANRRPVGTPRLVALARRARRTRLGCRAGSVTGTRTLPGAPPEARKGGQSPPGERGRRHLGQGNFSSRPHSNFPPRVGSCLTQGDPAAAARTRCPHPRPQRPITERLRGERQEGASSRRATAPMANGEPRWGSSLTPLTNGKGVALAEVPIQ